MIWKSLCVVCMERSSISRNYPSDDARGKDGDDLLTYSVHSIMHIRKTYNALIPVYS